jgi:hypothetical protein
LFYLIVFGFFYSNAFAQSPGSISVGGEFNLWFTSPKTVNNNQTVDGTKTTQFTLLPSFEYFVNEQLSIGLGIGYNVTRNKNVNGNTTTTTKWGTFYFQPYARKYFKLGDHLDLFGEAGVSLGFGNNVNETSNGTTTLSTKYAYSSYSIGINPGISFHVSDKVALETSFGFLGYQGSSTEVAANQKNKTNDFGVQLNTSTLTFGIRYFIK